MPDKSSQTLKPSEDSVAPASQEHSVVPSGDPNQSAIDAVLNDVKDLGRHTAVDDARDRDIVGPVKANEAAHSERHESRLEREEDHMKAELKRMRDQASGWFRSSPYHAHIQRTESLALAGLATPQEGHYRDEETSEDVAPLIPVEYK